MKNFGYRGDLKHEYLQTIGGLKIQLITAVSILTMFWRFRIENENWFKRVGQWSALFGSTRLGSDGCRLLLEWSADECKLWRCMTALNICCHMLIANHTSSQTLVRIQFLFSTLNLFYLLSFIISKQAHLNHLVNFRFHTDKHFMIRWRSAIIMF